jgi:hypothetical protein
MPSNVLLMILVGVGLLTGLVLLAWAARGTRSEGMTRPLSGAPALGMSVGMLLGALLGVIVWVSTGDFVFWVIFVGGGMVSGLAVGSSLTARGR